MTGERKENPEEYTVKLETVRHCPIIVGEGIINQLGRYFDFSTYSSIVLFTDANVRRFYGQPVLQTLIATGKKVSLLTIPVGEKAKSLSTVERGYGFLLENNVDRKGLICTLGGGVVGDVGGYIAATFLRGIDYIQLPTTLLAQVDSSIGGKVGINFGGKKNILGSFYQPKAVISDVALLKSLPPTEMRNGIAEVIKYALAMDEGLFKTLEQQNGKFNTLKLKDIVLQCAQLKAGIVEADETEKTGQRTILNFGHTVGHALEAATGLKKLSHGEAVAIGMVAAARISEELGRLKRGEVQRIESLLVKFGLPTSFQGADPDEIVEAIQFDKKTTFGQTGWVLLEDIGKGIVNQKVAENIVRKVLAEICR